MSMTFVVFFIIFMLLIFVFVAGIVYWAISHANKNNNEYLAFATAHGYQFDQAQGRDNYRDYSSRTISSTLTITPVQSPYLEKYANFSYYPFGCGHERKVAYVISGNYKGIQFRAFTYHFRDNTIEGTGTGGVFNVVMIECPNTPKGQLSEQVFYENGFLCEYQHGNLNVETIHDRVNQLGNIVQGL